MKTLLVRLITAALCAFSSAAWAGATLHIGSGYGTPCATGGCPLYNGEVNPFATQLDIYQTSGGAPSLVNPVLLIFGVANDNASSPLLGSSAITSASLISSGVPTAIGFSFGSSAFGLNGNGFQGLMTSGDVYGFLGLGSQVNNSNSFTNWSDWDLDVYGINAANFGIYVFALNTASFGGHDYLQLTTSGIPEGTFAVAYGRDANDQPYATPFTEAGLSGNTVPEPATGALLIVMLAILGLIYRKHA